MCILKYSNTFENLDTGALQSIEIFMSTEEKNGSNTLESTVLSGRYYRMMSAMWTVVSLFGSLHFVLTINWFSLQ